MAGPLSMDLRIRGLAAAADGASGRRVGDRFGVSAASVASVGAHAGRRVAKGGGRRPSFAEDRKPMVLDGPINGRAFQAYIDQLLVPELKPGDGVIMGQPHQGQPRIAQGRRHTRCLSRRPARSCSISRPTVPTSIRSRTLSPSSRRSCEKPHSAPSKDSGPKSPNCRLPLATPMRKPLRRRRIRSNVRGFRSSCGVDLMIRSASWIGRLSILLSRLKPS